jgi:hypothetical protein
VQSLVFIVACGIEEVRRFDADSSINSHHEHDPEVGAKLILWLLPTPRKLVCGARDAPGSDLMGTPGKAITCLVVLVISEASISSTVSGRRLSCPKHSFKAILVSHVDSRASPRNAKRCWNALR